MATCSWVACHRSLRCRLAGFQVGLLVGSLVPHLSGWPMRPACAPKQKMLSHAMYPSVQEDMLFGAHECQQGRYEEGECALRL